ncbi:lysine--tRNA ligase [Candidatus Xiphinematobacter sp. Idaho Grape]|uniref:lysine--tRNA ligase n=1 Tax=Candidatus Xiphinematobacter sp. Idaho Grape TaxID=1704307 RepID=UPI002A4E2699|nr:lysine--tRNA ligase [Candidatus Xiphinematobacter sp. Idaho Grape]
MDVLLFLSFRMKETPLSELIAVRRRKLESMRASGLRPYGMRFATSGSIASIRSQFADGKLLYVAGRVTAYRDMGNSQFLDLADITGHMQVFVCAKEIKLEDLEVLPLLDIGDFIGVTGECFTTKTREPTLRARSFQVLSKAIRPPPNKWYGIRHTETKYRQRYLDLISNPASCEVFRQRIRIIHEIRSYLEGNGFLEVETPMMQVVPGGAAAEPFKTHHRALDMDLFLRIAPELYLKQLLVAGFPRVFELNRNFRNEGISRHHSPEFTMLEAYIAYSDFEQMALLVEEMICHIAKKVCGGLLIQHKNEAGEIVRTIDLTPPWKRARYSDLIRSIQPSWYELSSDQKRACCTQMGLETTDSQEDFEITQRVFEKFVEEKIIDPLFVTHCPRELVPLAKQNEIDLSVVDAYELVINGHEISPGYSELNDPDIQRRRLEYQSGGEIQKLDLDFLTALEYGMPPAGGLGLGVDRLVMLLTGAESIRDVILFPHMRSKN